jgi:uroporphyrinogen decarboxylase
MDMLVDSISDHLIAQIDAGVEVVQIFDTWCSAVPQGMFRRLCLDPVRAIGARVKQAHGTVPVIAFPRGAGVRYGDFARAPEIDAVGIDSSVPLDWARAELQPHATVQGSLDPILLLEGGAAMETAAAEILDTLADGRFVFNLGHGVVPQTPPEHVAALVKLVHGGR